MSNPYVNIQQFVTIYDVRTLFQLSNDQNVSNEQAATIQMKLDLAAGEFESGISGYVPLPLPLVNRTVQDGAMGIGSTTLTTAASNPFAWSDIGKPITVSLAGGDGNNLQTTIAAFVTPGNVTLDAPNASGLALTGLAVNYPLIPLICTRWVSSKAAEGMFARRNDRPKQVVDDALWADNWMEMFRQRKVSIPGIGRNQPALVASGSWNGSSIYDNIYGLPAQRTPPGNGWWPNGPCGGGWGRG